MRLLPFLLAVVVLFSAIAFVAYRTIPVGATTRSEKAAEGGVKLPADFPFELRKVRPFPKAVCERPEHFFGTIRVGESRDHRFVIKNEGEVPLKLAKGPSTCQCTIPTLKKGELAPGEQAEIHLRVEPAGPSQDFVQSAFIYTDDPLKPELELQMRGIIHEIVEIDPPTFWSISQIKEEGVTEFTGHIFSKSLKNFEIKSIAPDQPYLKVEVTPMNEDGKISHLAESGYDVKCTLTPTMQVGPFIGHLNMTLKYKLVQAGDPDKNEPEREEEVERQYSLEINGNRSGPFSIIGASFRQEKMILNMGQVDPTKGKSHQLTLLLKKGSPDFEITGVESTEKGIKVTASRDTERASQLKGRDGYLLKFEIPPNSVTRNYTMDKPAIVTLKTNQPTFNELSFKVLLVVD